MATVYVVKRRSSGGVIYPVKYRDPQTKKKRHYRSFRRYADAKRAAGELRVLLDGGRLPEDKGGRPSGMLFGEVADSLLGVWAERGKAGSLSWKTVAGYSDRLSVLRREFGGLPLCAVTRELAESYVRRVAGSRSAVTANRCLSVLRKVFAYGIRIGACVADGTAGIRFLREPKRNSFLLPDKLSALLEAAGSGRAQYYLPALICLAAEHGASRQEALSLRWSDIDFGYKDVGLIRLYRSKNRRERVDYLMPRTREYLLAWREHLEWKRHRTKVLRPISDAVFCRVDGTPILRFDRAWQDAVRRAGISGFRYHDLRHTFCSNLILSGAGLKDVKELVGHADISMTDRYSHLTGAHRAVVQHRLAEHYACP